MVTFSSLPSMGTRYNRVRPVSLHISLPHRKGWFALRDPSSPCGSPGKSSPCSNRSTNTLMTDADMSSSMVKRVRFQSQEQPSFQVAARITPPYRSPFPGLFQESLTGNAGFGNPLLASWATTFASVAMEAWSVPGTQQAFLPISLARRIKHILQGIVEHMAHMQYPGNIGRRDNNRIGLPVVWFRMEVFMLKPVGIPSVFYLLGFVFGRDLHFFGTVFA